MSEYKPPTLSKVRSLTPTQHKFLYGLRQSKRLKELSKTDNKEVGDYSGMKSSIEDKAETISDAYMH